MLNLLGHASFNRYCLEDHRRIIMFQSVPLNRATRAAWQSTMHLRGRDNMWKVGRPDGDFQNLSTLLISDTVSHPPGAELLNPGSQY